MLNERLQCRSLILEHWQNWHNCDLTMWEPMRCPGHDSLSGEAILQQNALCCWMHLIACCIPIFASHIMSHPQATHSGNPLHPIRVSCFMFPFLVSLKFGGLHGHVPTIWGWSIIGFTTFYHSTIKWIKPDVRIDIDIYIYIYDINIYTHTQYYIYIYYYVYYYVHYV